MPLPLALSLAAEATVWQHALLPERPKGLLELPASDGPYDDHSLTFPPGKLLPAVQCIFYVALVNSTQAPLFQRQMESLGLWDRVTTLFATPDPQGKAAGCWRQHVSAWRTGLKKGCAHALILEEDAYLHEVRIAPWPDQPDLLHHTPSTLPTCSHLIASLMPLLPNAYV